MKSKWTIAGFVLAALLAVGLGMSWQRSIEFERRAQQAEARAKAHVATIDLMADAAKRIHLRTGARTDTIKLVDAAHPVTPENQPNIDVRDRQIADLTLERDTLTTALGIARTTIDDLRGTLASRPSIILTPPRLSLKPSVGLGVNVSLNAAAQPEVRVGINVNFVSWRPW